MKKIFTKRITFVCFLLLILNIKCLNASTSRLSGRILLQVEQNGEAWYVNPDNEKRYFLGRPKDAFALMRKLGLGISEVDYNKFQSNDNKASSALSGKILLRVESNGEAYYVNPNDLKMHYLGRPQDAFQVMRDLGLGISDNDLANVAIEKHNSTVSAEESEEIELIEEEAEEIVISYNEYIGPGTYDFKKGDSILDEVNKIKWTMVDPRERNEHRWMVFERYNIETGERKGDFVTYVDPEKLYIKQEPDRTLYEFNLDFMHMYEFTYNTHNLDGSYNLSFDFKLKDVLGDTAVGDKDILVVPVYFDDEYEVFGQFGLYRDNFLEPALTEIEAYIKIKQTEILGKEIMSIDFTVADAFKSGKADDYLPSAENTYSTRDELVRNNTDYNPDNFDVIAFMFFTEEATISPRNTARFNQAMITFHQSPITDTELNTPIQIHQKRNTIRVGLLHEILHTYGMSDENGSGKRDYFRGKLYDGSQVLEDDLSDEIDTYTEIGRFQGIDQAVANEIGWCDINGNEILDANEYFTHIIVQ